VLYNYITVLYNYKDITQSTAIVILYPVSVALYSCTNQSFLFHYLPY